MKLRNYIKKIRKITITQGAQELGCSRGHLSYIVNGGSAGKKLANKIQLWSGSVINRDDLMYPADIQPAA